MRHDIAKHIKQLNDLRNENIPEHFMDVLYDENKEDIDYLNQEFLDSFDSTIGPMNEFIIKQHNVECLDAVQLIWDSYKKIEKDNHKTRKKLVDFVLKDLFIYYKNLGFHCEVRDASGYNVSFEVVFKLKF